MPLFGLSGFYCKSRNQHDAGIGIALNYFLLQKAGQRFRLDKQVQLGPLQRLSEQPTNTGVLARWILARIYVSQTALTQSEHQKFLLYNSAYQLVSDIKEPIDFDSLILLPGIRSETSPDLLKGDFNGLADPKVKRLPVPHRYLANYLLNLANYMTSYDLREANARIRAAKRHCKLSLLKYGYEHPYLSTNIDLCNNIIDAVLICKGDAQISRNKVINRFQSIQERVENLIRRNQIPEDKGYEWITACYAGLSALTVGSEHLKYLDLYHQQVRSIVQSGRGYADFFMIDIIYQLANKSKEEEAAFQVCIKYSPPDKDKKDPSGITVHTERFYLTINNNKIMETNFQDISGSTINNHSAITNSFNTIGANYGEDVAKALEDVRLLVEQSGNKEAAELFDQFTEETRKEKPKRSVLASLWDGLTKLVPLLSSGADVVDKITKLFHP